MVGLDQQKAIKRWLIAPFMLMLLNRHLSHFRNNSDANT